MNNAKRDPRVDPRPGDIVRAIAARPAILVGTFAALTVQAVVGNLIATTSDETDNREVMWQPKETWCKTGGVWIREWEVLYAAD